MSPRIDLDELRRSAHQDPHAASALALLSIAQDVRAVCEAWSSTAVAQPAAARTRRVRSLVRCVECGSDTVERISPAERPGEAFTVERCSTCDFMIDAAEAAGIRARVEGAGS